MTPGNRTSIRFAVVATTALFVQSVAAQEITVAAVGDLIYLRPAQATLERQSPELVAILRNANVTFGNFEASSFRLDSFKGSPQIKASGPLVLAWPGAPNELKALGFKLLSYANNHTFDFGAEGTLATGRALRAAGLVFAGAGETLHAAREPRYFGNDDRRVALVAATSAFQTAAPAADAFGKVPAHPGVNALRTNRTALVDTRTLDSLRRIAASAPKNSEDNGVPPPGGVRLLGQNFAAGGDTDRMRYSFEMNAEDEKAILDTIVAAKRNSTLALLSLHTHEATTDVLEPADFVVTLAHRAIDSGADAFLGHGAHQLRGIEIYKGKPIFYSLGNFAVMLPTAELNPGGFVLRVEDGKVVAPPLANGAGASLFTERAFFESVIAVSRYSESKLIEIRLHPFELAVTGEPATHGLPQAVNASTANAILGRLQALSKPFGTKISIENGIGVIRP